MVKHLIPFLKAFLCSFDSIIEKKTGLSCQQVRILGYLECNSDRTITQKDIELASEVSRAAVSSILAKMEASLLIEREQDENDGRRNVIRLTEIGKERAKEVFAILSSIEAELFSVLTDEEMLMMDNMKEKLSRKLEDLR